jgi:hypothetical protein
MAELALSRSARKAVKRGGICCTMTIGTGQSPGKCRKTSASAFGPPVEVPMQRIPNGTAARRGGASFASTLPAAAGRRGTEGGGRGVTWQSALILGISSS